MANSKGLRDSIPTLIQLHMRWLSIVVAGTVIGQWLVLHSGTDALVGSDSFLYISDAHAIPGPQGLVDAMVPPGYPVLVSAIFLIAGQGNVTAVLWFQVVLMIAMVFELYALGIVAGLHRAAASAIATAAGAAPWLIQWERWILTEGVSVWLMVTLFLMFGLFVRRPTMKRAVLCGLVGAGLPLVRPAQALVPATLIAVLALRVILLRRKAGAHRLTAATVVVFGVTSYLPVGAYAVANAVVNSCYCYTDLGNLNLFGKLYEYGMQDLPASPEFSSVSAQVRSSSGVNEFLAAHPEYESENYANLGAFARSQLLRYPELTLSHTWSDLQRVLGLDIDHAVLVDLALACQSNAGAPSPLFIPVGLSPSDGVGCRLAYIWVAPLGQNINRMIYFGIFLSYVALPAGFLLGAALVLTHSQRERSWMLLSVASVIAVVVFGIVAEGYQSFDRLRVPTDPLALLMIGLLIGEIGFAGRQAVRRAMPPAVPRLPVPSA